MNTASEERPDPEAATTEDPDHDDPAEQGRFGEKDLPVAGPQYGSPRSDRRQSER
jgi:hypothetical protein